MKLCGRSVSSRDPGWTALLALLLWTPAGNGAEGWRDTLQWHGFLTQGYVNTSANRWYGDSDSGDGSWDFREIGLNASVRPTSRLQITGQLLSRAAGDMADGHVQLDFGLLDYTLLASADSRAGVRAGRYKSPLGLYNDTRDVAFTRPSIFLPQSIYLDRTRNLMLSADGLEFYGGTHVAGGELGLELGLGYPLLDANVEYSLMGRDWDGGLEGNQPVVVGRLMYETDGGGIRVGLSGVMVTLDFAPGPGDPRPPVLDAGEIGLDLWIASFQYNAERWSFTSEYSRQSVDWSNLGLLFPQQNIPDPEGYYFQGSWQLSPAVELLLRYDVKYTDRKDRSGERTAGRTGLPPHAFFARDWTLGMRWDVLPELMLRAEYHRVEGATWLSNRENDFRDTERDWELFSLLMSYRF